MHSRKPLYSTGDVTNCLDISAAPRPTTLPVELAPGLRATFIDAGHILGSASIFLELEESGQRRSILFSGDIGNPGHPLLRGPVTPPHADAVVMETTYGDRLHKSLTASVEELYGAIVETLNRDGNVIIPTFALERAQELLYFLRAGVEQSRLANSIQVYLDSPMAVSATEIFERHPECYDDKTAEMFRDGHDPFQVPGLHFVRDTAGSIAINSIRGGAIIMAGSGMATGGRIRHHLKHNLWRPECSIVFVGYAADGTLARRIIDGAKHVQNSRRRHSGAGAHSHRQRFFGARRSSGAVGLAEGDAGRPYLSRSRRGSLHAAIRLAADRHARRNAEAQRGVRSVRMPRDRSTERHQHRPKMQRRAALADDPSIVRPWPGYAGDGLPCAREPGGGLDHLG